MADNDKESGLFTGWTMLPPSEEVGKALANLKAAKDALRVAIESDPAAVVAAFGYSPKDASAIAAEIVAGRISIAHVPKWGGVSVALGAPRTKGAATKTPSAPSAAALLAKVRG